MADEDLISKDDFITYSSPRYYRLIFSELKPTTKNGSLVSALKEMKRSQLLAPLSDWDRIILTKKGQSYKNILKKFLKKSILNVPQSDGLFDYRSDIGRKCICELIIFLVNKYNFSKYGEYMKMPIFSENEEESWKKFIDGTVSMDGGENSVSSKEQQENLLEFLREKRSFVEKRTTKKIQKTVVDKKVKFQLDLSIIRKFFKQLGMNRPTPLITHLVSSKPLLFEKKSNKSFYVNFPILHEIYNILENNIQDLKEDESLWLNRYFELLDLPSNKYGFGIASQITYATKTDAFLNMAIEGPRMFASQFSRIKDFGNLQLILFPINPEECLVISDIVVEDPYYFTISNESANYSLKSNMINPLEIPEVYRTSHRRFGKLLNISKSFEQSIYDYTEHEFEEKLDEIRSRNKENDSKFDKKKLKSIINIEKTKRKVIEKERELKIEKAQALLNDLSHYSASLITTCQMITDKITPNFQINKVVSIYEHGIIEIIHVISNNTYITYIKKGTPELGKKLDHYNYMFRRTIEEITTWGEEGPNN